jgi:hypothetical protein
MIKAFALPALSLAISLTTGCATDSDTADEATPTADTQDVSHCLTQIGSSDVTCYASFTELISAATGGRITDAPSDARVALADPAFHARVDAVAKDRSVSPRTGGPLIGIEFIDAGFSGGQLGITAPYGTGCDGNLATNDYSYTTFPTYPDNWNDNVSSFESFAGCEQKLFENGGFGGASTPIEASMSYVGENMNDKASSILFY